MDWGAVTAYIIAAILGAVLLGIPVAVSLGLVSVFFLWAVVGSEGVMSTVATEFMGFWSSYTMIALPLFVIMGEFLFTGGVTADLFDFAAKWLRRIPGGLCMVALGVGTIFGTLSGSSLAAISTIGVMAGPEMIKRGYDKRLIAGSITGAGTLAHIIPPSIMIVLYAGMVEISVGKALMAGFLPGLLLAVIFGTIIVTWVRLRPSAAPAEPPVSWKERMMVIRKLLLPLLVAAVVLGSIYTGVTTVTEAAGMGALAAIIIAIAYRKISFKQFLNSGMSAVKTTCFIMLIAVGGKMLSLTLTYYLIPQHIVSAIVSLPIAPMGIMVLMQVLLFFLGMFIDPVSIIIITTPIFIPVLTALHFDFIWYGILLMVNMGMALITPPLGFALYIVKGILGEQITLNEVLKGSLVFLIGEAVAIALLMAFPIIALWLPSLMG